MGLGRNLLTYSPLATTFLHIRARRARRRAPSPTARFR